MLTHSSRLIFGLLLLLALTSCSSIPQANPLFPAPTTTTYLAPDDRKWVLQKLEKPTEGRYAGGYILKFTPSEVAKGQETEILSFGYWKENFSPEELKKRFQFTQQNFDVDLTFTVEGTSSDSFYIMHSPAQKEYAVQRSVLRGEAYCFISYSTLHGAKGILPPAFWVEKLKNWPVGLIQPAPDGEASH